MPRSLILLALIAAPVGAESVVGLTPTQYDAWIKSLAAKKEMPRVVSVHSVAGKPVFAAISASNPGKLAFNSKQGLTPAAFNARFKQLSADGYRLECLCPYHTITGSRFTDLWVKDKSVPFDAKYGLTGEDFQKLAREKTKLGFRPVCVNGYLDGKATRYAAVFHQAPGPEWAAHEGSTEKEFEKLIKDYQGKGFRPTFLSVFNDGKVIRVNFVAEKIAGGWSLQHGVTAGAIQKDNEARAREGLEPGGITGFTSAGGSRYSAYWVKPGGKPVIPVKIAELQATGTEVPELADFDKAMIQYMKEREIEAGAICVMRAGKIVLSRGYGFLTKDHKKPLPPDAPFRIASVTKPITAAIVRDLARKGKFKLSDKAFEYIGIDLPPGRKLGDERLKDVTIQHLLDHKGGFDRDAKPLGDPMFQPALVRKALKLEDAPTPADMVRFMNTRKLDFAPGTKEAYSNYGYCVLGRVIEKATGETYGAHVRRFVAPLGIKSFALGRSLPDDRDPAEPFYSDPGFTLNCITGSGNVPWPDGGFNLEAMDSHGGLIASAPDLARFFQAYWIGGEPRKGDGEKWQANGSLPGTFTRVRQRPDGVNIVALFNQRSGPPGKKPEVINDILDKVADGIKTWP